MTSQKDQIQALITDIDSVLQKTTPRLPWVVSGEMTQQRQILERVRNYLVTFQRRQMAGEGFEQAGARPDLLAHDIYYQPAQASYQSPQAGPEAERSLPYGPNEVAAQQMLQALVQEMGYLRSNVVQPLQSDVEGLRQQREALVQEIRQLEAQRQGYVGPVPGNQQQVIAEFLQALMTRLQETLPQQVAQSLRSGNQPSLPYSGNLALSGSAPVVATTDTPYPGSGNIQVPQSQADELLIKLDSTLSVVFESLQRNVQAYEESLSQGLSKMHSLGQQGEMMFTALISHLASQLGQEASAYLQPPTASRLEAARGVAPMSGSASNATQTAQPSSTPTVPSFLEQPNAPTAPTPTAPSVDAAKPLTLPFPGTELSNKAPTDASAASPAAAEPVDTAIDSWLRSAAGAGEESPVDLEIAELNLEGFDLNQLAAQDVNALLELDANLLGTNLPPQPLLAPQPPTASGQPAGPPSGTVSAEDTSDIDAALKLLEQLSSELEEQPASVADADAQIDRMLSSPPATPSETATGSIPDDAKDELDEFYESLFGNQTSTGEPAAAELAAPVAEAPATEAPTAVEVPTIGTAPSAGQMAQPSATAELASVTEPQPPSALQPIDTLPADTKAPEEVLAQTAVVSPSVSTSADPTLGWDLATQPSASQAAEPEIPAALLEDELLEGWDLDDAEVDLESLGMPPDDDPLGLGETTTGDRAPDALAATPSFDTTAASSEPQSLVAEPMAESLPATEAPRSQDEIATLTDLFDEAPPEQPTSEASIEPSIEPSAGTTGQTAAVPAASVSPPVLPVVPASTPSQTQPGEDRYASASPEEDLLPLQGVAEEADPELWLDENTLNRLSEDLFNLEEAIGDPAVLPYASEPSADEPTLLPNTTVSNEPVLSNELMSLGNWDDVSTESSADSLPAVDAPSQASSESAPEANTAQPDAFILEGMDDLFANTPAEPPVVPIAPPASPSAEPSAAFTLEGMSNLFADPMGDSVAADAAPSPLSSLDSQTLPFTLQGMDDLFGDVPEASSEPVTSEPAAAEQPLPFTLEGVDSLFADVPSIAEVPSAPATATTTPSQEPPAFSFESVEADASATPPPEPSAFSFEQVGNLFVEVPSASVPADTGSQETIAPPVEPSPEPTHEPTTPFTLEQVGDLFMEIPAGAGIPSGASPASETGSIEAPPPSPGPVSEAASTPFSLEAVGDLFADAPSGEPLLDLTASPILQPPPLEAEGPATEAGGFTTEPAPPELNTAEPSTLEQAFASLMGVFDEPTPPASDGTADSQDPEKKKGMS